MRTYVLDRTAKTSLYEQLYRGLRADIESGALAAGARLPSKRALAAHLGVSVVTVEGAYDQLLSEGYVAARPRSGFFVQEMTVPVARNAVFGATSAAGGAQADGFCLQKSANGADSATLTAPCAPKTHFCAKNGDVSCTMLPREALQSGQAGVGLFPSGQAQGEEGGVVASLPECFADFTGARAPEGLFPYQAWARTLRRVLADESERTVLEAAASQGSPRLRRAIADHLRGFRGMEVHPDQIVVGSGAQSLYGLLVQLLGRNRVYGVEDPGYPRLARIYRSNDVQVAAVPVDEAGPLPAALAATGADVLHCMPSHQFPLGTTTPVGRRGELLAWARSGEREGGDKQEWSNGWNGGGGRYLIEDDFDCEFRMTGRPVPPMQALDRDGRVIYANTFTKTLGAAFRIGYVVLPWELAARFRDRLGFYTCTVGALEQLTLARFMESGDYERHVNRQRTYFRRVQNALVEALGASKAADCLQLRNVGAGLHFLMEVRGAPATDAAACEQAVAEAAAVRGVRLAPLSAYRMEGTASVPAFVMSFASLAEERAPDAAAAIAAAVREVLSR